MPAVPVTRLASEDPALVGGQVVMMAAEQSKIVEGGRLGIGPGPYVVGFEAKSVLASGNDTSAVPDPQCGPLGGGGSASDVSHRTDVYAFTHHGGQEGVIEHRPHRGHGNRSDTLDQAAFAVLA